MKKTLSSIMLGSIFLLAGASVASAATINLGPGESQLIGGFNVTCDAGNGGGGHAPVTYWVCTLDNSFFGVNTTGRGETREAAHAAALTSCRREHSGTVGSMTCNGATESCEQVTE